MKTLLNHIYCLLEALLMVFKHVFKKPVTLEYPEEQPSLPSSFRGKHVLKGCVGCGICKQVCPANAISFEKIEDKVVSYKIDLKRCIFCGNCQYHCPFNAIKHSDSFDLASNDKANLIMELASVKEDKQC